MEILIAFVIRLLVFLIEIWLANTLDTGEKVCFEKKKLIVAVVYLFCSAVLGKENAIVLECISGFFWGSLAAAAYSDWQIKKAYDFQNWIAIGTAIVAFFVAARCNEKNIIGLVFFCLLQVIIYRLLYGAADVMNSISIAIYLVALGWDIVAAFEFLIIAYILLFVVQLCKKNVNKWGNLKEAKGLLPYFAVALLLYI